MSHFSTEMTPEHFDRVQPRTISRQVEQNQTSSCGTNNLFHFIILMSREVVPGHKNCSRGMFVQQSLQQLGHFLASLSFADQDHGFTSMVVDRSQAIVNLGLTRGRDHHLLPFGTPHRTQGREPTDIEFICIVEYIACLQSVSGFFNLLFFTWYSGSGLLIVC